MAAGVNAFEVFAKIGLDTADFEKGISGTQSGLAGFASNAFDAFAKIGKYATGAAEKFLDLTGSAAAYGDEIDKQSQKLGISATEYQEWDAILQHSGTSIETMTTATKKLAEAVQNPTEKSAAAFEALGISIDKAAGMSQQQLFNTVIEQLQGMESGTERTALASELLGRSSLELGALLNTSAEETEAMRQRVHELGGVMSDEAVKASAAYQDNLQDLKTAISGVKNTVASDFLPSVSAIMQGVTSMIAGEQGAAEKVGAGIDSITDTAIMAADNIFTRISDLLPALIETFTKNAPKVGKMAMKITETLANGLLKASPEILNTGAFMLTEFVKGLAESAPKAIPTITRTALDLVNILTKPEVITGLFTAATELIIGLSDGLINAIPELLETAPDIITNLGSALVTNAPLLIDTAFTVIEKLATFLLDGKNIDRIATTAFEIVVELANSIVGALWKIGESAAKIVKRIADEIGLGDYWQMGADIIGELMQGVMDKWNEWANWWSGFGEYIYDALHPNAEEGDSSPDWTSYGYNAIHGAESVPDMPKLASGGIVTRPTVAMIGEAGAEAVIPLTSAKLGTSITINQTNHITVKDGSKTGAEVIEQIDEALKVYQIRTLRGFGTSV